MIFHSPARLIVFRPSVFWIGPSCWAETCGTSKSSTKRISVFILVANLAPAVSRRSSDDETFFERDALGVGGPRETGRHIPTEGDCHALEHHRQRTWSVRWSTQRRCRY